MAYQIGSNHQSGDELRGQLRAIEVLLGQTTAFGLAHFLDIEKTAASLRGRLSNYPNDSASEHEFRVALETYDRVMAEAVIKAKSLRSNWDAGKNIVFAPRN